MKLTKEPIQTAQQLLVPRVACFKEPGGKLGTTSRQEAIGVSHGTLVLHRQWSAVTSSLALCSLPIIR